VPGARALKLERRHYKALYQRGLLHLDEQKHDAGVADLRRVLTLRSDYGPAHYALGRALLERSPGKARHHFHEALVARPPVLRAHLDLARLFEAGGALDRDRNEYALYLRHHPGRRDDAIRRKLAELDVARARR